MEADSTNCGAKGLSRLFGLSGAWERERREILVYLVGLVCLVGGPENE